MEENTLEKKIDKMIARQKRIEVFLIIILVLILAAAVSGIMLAPKLMNVINAANEIVEQYESLDLSGLFSALDMLNNTDLSGVQKGIETIDEIDFDMIKSSLETISTIDFDAIAKMAQDITELYSKISGFFN